MVGLHLDDVSWMLFSLADYVLSLLFLLLSIFEVVRVIDFWILLQNLNDQRADKLVWIRFIQCTSPI